MRSRRAVVGLVVLTVLVVLAVLVVLSGCAQPGRATTPTPSPTAVRAVDPDVLAGLGVELHQARTERADRVVRLRVRNDSGTALHVSAGELDSPQLERVATTEPGWGRRVPAGGTRDAPVPLGRTRCGVSPTPATARLRVADEQGGSASVSVAVTDPHGLLERIQAEDCARAAVAAGAQVAIGEQLSTARVDGTLVATLELVVTPVEGGPEVVVESVDATVLLRPPGGGSWPVDVSTADGPARVPLRMVPTRCDPHAVAEDKRGTFFGLRAVVDGVAQPVHHLAVSPALGARLYEFVGEHCGW